MEWVAKTGGMIGTWPLAAGQKKTLRDWAEEICAMKSRLGMAHIGLGTDGGGRLPKTVEGYANIKDLHKLATTLTEVGLGQEDLRAFLGGNLERVVRAILKN
jgi:microsomal dipeptidase-like Zn-dependent dipeptidase